MKEEKYERMLERAKHLMETAEDPAASADEAAVAWGRALMLVAKYAGEDARLDRQERLNDPAVKVTVDLQPDSLSLQKADLAGVVARGNQADVCSVSYKAGSGRKVVESITFCGTERAVLQAELIWVSMETRRAFGWRRAAISYWGKPGYWGKPAAGWRDSYYEGFACRISDRYQELRREQGKDDSIAGAGNEPVMIRGAQVADSMRGLDPREADPPDTWFHLNADALREGAHDAADVILSLAELHRLSRQTESKEA